MSEAVILNLRDLSLFGRTDLNQQIEEIFFESTTKKEFKDQAERDGFLWKYLNFYLIHYPEYVWLAIREHKVLGYVVGMPFTQDPSLYKIQPHLALFQEEYGAYPAHLHINCHADSRGQGIGQRLVQTLTDQLQSTGILGIHIMTGLDSQNRAFYQKMEFDFQVERIFNGHTILFMGKSLSDK